ncbi:hypothetical protein INT47_009577 [Mucor saturninus]|uniref:Uncharacterized protein n=1 Tax=Mucor saturninus TaxID=64648 RepID=A0A8H7QRQ0_9FUNG|nr:hypothetical protein INT47_009577 [Mucor saturninus]
MVSLSAAAGFSLTGPVGGRTSLVVGVGCEASPAAGVVGVGLVRETSPVVGVADVSGLALTDQSCTVLIDDGFMPHIIMGPDFKKKTARHLSFLLRRKRLFRRNALLDLKNMEYLLDWFPEVKFLK